MKVIVTLIALFVLSSAAWTSDHQLTGDASIQIAEGVKNQLLANINKFANQEVAQALLKDLNESDDSKRTLTSIDTTTANQLFSVFGLKDPNCDKNADG